MRHSLHVALFGLLSAACTTPTPRVPFQGGSGWHAFVLSGDRTHNRGFTQTDHTFGVELVLDAPGTGGWAFEVGSRLAGGKGEGQRTVEMDVGPIDERVVVDSQQGLNFFELDFGVRQTFREGAALQPYFGLGVAALYAQTEENYVQPQDLPEFSGPTPATDCDSETRPGIYLHGGILWNVARDQLGENTEFPLALDVRGLLSTDYSYLELALAIGFGK